MRNFSFELKMIANMKFKIGYCWISFYLATTILVNFDLLYFLLVKVEKIYAGFSLFIYYLFFLKSPERMRNIYTVENVTDGAAIYV